MTTDNGNERNYDNGSEDTETTMNINTDENISGSAQLDEPVSQEDQVEKVQGELREMKDKYLRLVAEFENFKKRNARERLELIPTAGREVIQSLLVILDDMERAEKQFPNINNADEIKDGVLLVFNKLRSTLNAKGLKPMKSIGEDFDPDRHEAITEIPAPNPGLKGKVVDEVEKGYYLNDKIIRFAKVVVGK